MSIAETAAIVNALNNSGGGGGGTPSGGSAYDFVISVDVTTSTFVYSLESGDFDKVVAKLNNQEMVMGCQHAFEIDLAFSGQNYIFTGAEYIEEDDHIVTYWRYIEDPNQTMTLVWQRDGTVFED